MNEKWSAYCCLLWCSICKVVFAIEIFLFAWANSKCSDIKWLWAMWIECLFRVCMNWRIIYLFIMSNYRNHNDTTTNTKRKKKSAEQRNSKNRLRTLFVWANKTYSNLPKTEHKINKSNKKPILPHFTFTYKLQQLLVTTAGWCVWFLSFMLHFFVFFLSCFDLIWSFFIDTQNYWLVSLEKKLIFALLFKQKRELNGGDLVHFFLLNFFWSLNADYYIRPSQQCNNVSFFVCKYM